MAHRVGPQRDESTRQTVRSSAEGPVVTVVVQAVADHKDTRLLDLPPLGETLDADALNALFELDDSTCEVRFQYADCAVIAAADGTVRVADADTGPSPDTV